MDLVSASFARLPRHMRRTGSEVVVPRLPRAPMAKVPYKVPYIETTSGYFERSRALLPLQGEAALWRLRQHYAKDAKLFRGRVDDGVPEFS